MNDRRAFASLLAAATAAHAGDQLAIAALPLVAATVLAASPAEVGLLVAAQSAAWLLGSLPAGALADRWGQLRLLALGQMLAFAGAAAILIGAALGHVPVVAIAALATAAGGVTFALAGLALVPRLVAGAALPRANARIELARGLCALAAPALAGLLAQRAAPIFSFVVVAALAAVSLVVLRDLAPRLPAQRHGAGSPSGRGLRAGALFVARHGVLRAIAACAIAWNFAHGALLAVFVPFALQRLALRADETGLVLAAFGAGAVVAALSAGAIFDRLSPRVVLIGGPAASLLAGSLLVQATPADGPWTPAAAFALLGFGPMLWSICQTSLRQVLTPPHLLGRVSASMQVAIYGARPLGALLAAGLASGHGFDAVLALVVGGFAASTLAALASPLARLAAMPRMPT